MLAYAGPFPQIPVTTGETKAKVRIQAWNPCLPHGCQVLSYFGHHPLPTALH